MDATLSTAIAVVGTLLGSAATYRFRQMSADHSEQAARAERFRQERLAVLAEFAGMATDLRRCVYDR